MNVRWGWGPDRTLARLRRSGSSWMQMIFSHQKFVWLGILCCFLGACNSSTPPPSENYLKIPELSGYLSPISPKGTPNPTSAPSTSTFSTEGNPSLGPSCAGGDSSELCLALKYVTYRNDKGASVVSQGVALKNLETMNALFKPCSVAFQIDRFDIVAPWEEGLQYRPANTSELNDIRKTYEDDSSLLIVTTASWNRSGSLGNTGANAWTNMPGQNLYGAVLESNVGDFGNIIAHEVGHYLGLYHESNTSNLMNPTIYASSKVLTSSQCSVVRATIRDYWDRMIRT